jgi:exosortase A
VASTDRPATDQAGSWARQGVLLALLAGGLLALYHETVWGMVSIWIRSETFAHGFLIVPIAGWLVWERRRELSMMTPQPNLRPLWLTLPLGLGWLLGHLVEVLVVQQLAMVGLLVVILWVGLGNRLARRLAFPLGFLFFAVPIGEGLIPPMMSFTTDFTVHMLRLTGIPVYQEGTFFSIPSGDWSVVEGCSGVRYLIASVTLGVLYAYLTYTRLWKRLLFTLVAIVVPVFANGLRAYMIVMIAYLSDMKLALGVDHLIYGWVFFGIVVTIMFTIGAFWRDPPAPTPTPDEPPGPPAWTGAQLVLVSLAAVAVWPLLGQLLDRSAAGDSDLGVALHAPPAVGGWQVSDESAWDWRPQVLNPDGHLYRFYRKDGRVVGLYLGVYAAQRQGAELVNSQNIMVRQKHPEWSNKGEWGVSASLDGRPVQVLQAKLVSPRLRLLAWHWDRVGSLYTTNDYLAKLWQALQRLTGGRRDGAFIVVATPYENRPHTVQPVLQSFIDAMLPGIERSLDQAVGRG